MSKRKLNQDSDYVFVYWQGNNDPSHDGKYNYIPRSMIANITEDDVLTIGTKIKTKRWPHKPYFGVVLRFAWR